MPKIAVVDFDLENYDLVERMAAKEDVMLERFDERSADAIIRNAQGADGIITSYGEFPARVFEALAPKLKVVSRTGVGFDSIDVTAATHAGVAVCTAPGYANEVVSDHAIALALAVLRRINEQDANLRAGIWDYASTRPLGQVRGRTFGIVGMGAIGRACARKAAGLGFDVVCWSRSLVPGTTTPEGYRALELDELLRTADVVSLHCALTDDTRHLIDADRLALMKPTAVIVNTARGSIIDTAALADALRAGKLWGAGIDVFEHEPILEDDPLFSAPHTVLTPHAAYWSEESGRELAERTARSAIDVVCGRRPADCLNPEVFA